jgi:hypothetical protein
MAKPKDKPATPKQLRSRLNHRLRKADAEALAKLTHRRKQRAKNGQPSLQQ